MDVRARGKMWIVKIDLACGPVGSLFAVTRPPRVVHMSDILTTEWLRKYSLRLLLRKVEGNRIGCVVGRPGRKGTRGRTGRSAEITKFEM